VRARPFHLVVLENAGDSQDDGGKLASNRHKLAHMENKCFHVIFLPSFLIAIQTLAVDKWRESKYKDGWRFG